MQNMKFMKVLDVASWLLLLIGSLNWGLVGFFDYNLITAIFGYMSLVSRIIYAGVGVAALYELFALRMIQERWTPICRQPEMPEVHPS